MTHRDPINLNHLRYFFEVARAGNMRRAAARIGISQPALSKQIQALEDTVGLQLFFRTPKGLQPTSDGDLAFHHCEPIFGHLRDLELALDARRTGSAGRLTIGVIHSISTHILPAYLARYREALPSMRTRVVAVRSQSVLRALEAHKVDIGLIAEKPPGAQLDAQGQPTRSTRETAAGKRSALFASEFAWRAFDKAPLVVVAAPKHPLHEAAKVGPLPASALHHADMVAFDAPAPTRRMTDRYLAKLGVEPRVMSECPSLEAIKEQVVANLGFAVLPAQCVLAEAQSGRLAVIPIQDWALERTLYIVHLAGAPLPPAVQRFADLFPTLPASPA